MQAFAALALLGVAAAASPPPLADEALVRAYVQRHGNQTFRPPSGQLKFPYLVPGGYYQQLWDWDSYQTGVALLEHGSAPFLAGSMKNFLSGVNLTDGQVPGCLTPAGASPAIYHVKPVVIQGAWIGASYSKDWAQFKPFLAQMKVQTTHIGIQLWIHFGSNSCC